MNIDDPASQHLQCRKYPGVSMFSTLAWFCFVICLLVLWGWFVFLQMSAAISLIMTFSGFSSEQNLFSG